MLNIFQPWVNKQRLVVGADRYFALVQAFDKLKKCGFGFIGVVNIETRVFCMEKLLEIELAQKQISFLH